MWHQVVDYKISSLQYFDFVIQNLPKESADSSLTDALFRTKSLIQLYVPIEKK
jgi:hypothetical protein